MSDTTEALPPLPFINSELIKDRPMVTVHQAQQYAKAYARAALAQRQQVPTTAWLVEWRFNGVQWLYLWPSAPGGFSFTSDASKALRFARREDAEAALQWARDTDAARKPIGSLTRHGLALGEMLVTEHDWPALIAAPSAQAEPVAWIRHEWSGTGQRSLSFDGPPDTKPVRDEVVNPVWTPLYASPPAAQAEPLRAHLSRARAMMQAFCDRVEAGQVRSVKTYSAFKAFLEETRDV